MRTSHVYANSDTSGPFETEVFDCEQPEGVIVCVHGNGVRRWDGERFFYQVAEHFSRNIIMLVDQCQIYGDGCQLNSMGTAVARVQRLVNRARDEYAEVPCVVMGHSMGCAVASRLNLASVDKLLFVAPAAGNAYQSLVNRYGPDIVDGKLVTTSDGLSKMISKSYVESVRGTVWEDDYRELLNHFSDVHVFEAGNEEIVSDERFKHRDMPFAGYAIIPGAKHNFSGEPLQLLFAELDKIVRTRN